MDPESQKLKHLLQQVKSQRDEAMREVSRLRKIQETIKSVSRKEFKIRRTFEKKSIQPILDSLRKAIALIEVLTEGRSQEKETLATIASRHGSCCEHLSDLILNLWENSWKCEEPGKESD